MNAKKLAFAAVAIFTLSATTLVSVSPAAAWGRWGRCGGWGWRGPGILAAPFVAAGVVAGAAVGTAAAVAGAPYRAYGVCPAGWHLGPAGRRCRPDY